MHTNLVNFKIDFPIIKRGAIVFVQCSWNKLIWEDLFLVFYEFHRF